MNLSNKLQWTKICYVCHLISVNSMKLTKDTWNNPWSGFYGIAWNFSLEFHGKCPNPLWKMSMEKFPWKLVDPWRNFS